MQYTQFLIAEVSGTPNLATVAVQEKTARAVTGTAGSISFEDYHALLVQQAQIFETANKIKNPTVSRSVNMMEILFEDGTSEREYMPVEYEAQVHNIDTDIEVLMAQSQQRPSGNRMSGGTR